jgi:HEAT repeat protein
MDPRTTVRRILATGRALPPKNKKKILELGTAGVPFLVELVKDRALYDQESAGHGWAPVHALQILGELQAVDAIPALIDVVRVSDSQHLVFSAAVIALQAIGPPALEPVLAAFAAGTEEQKTSFADVLAGLKTKDERIWDALVAAYPLDRPLGASNLGAYGDARAVPLLLERLDATADLMEILATADALVALGEKNLERRREAKVRLAWEQAREEEHRRRRG